MTQGEDNVSRMAGMDVYLPTGQKLGVVYDVVIDTDGIRCTHLFVRETDHELVEGGINLAIPWRWVRRRPRYCPVALVSSYANSNE